MSINYNGGDGTYWLIISAASTTPSGWTLVSNSPYYYRKSSFQPGIPDQSMLLVQATVSSSGSGSAITQVVDYRDRLIGGLTVETASYTTSRQVRWIIQPGGMLKPNAGVTISHAGTIEAGEYQIFDLSSGGTVTFPGGATVQAAWWGAQPGVDSAAAIQNALTAAPKKMDVRLGVGTYLVGNTIVSPIGTNGDWALRGQGPQKTILQRTNTFVGIIMRLGNVVDSTNRYRIEQLGIDGIDRNTAGVVGLRVRRAGQSQFRDLFITNCDKGIHLSGGSYHTFSQCFVTENTFGMIIDNQGDNPPTLIRVEDTLFRHNEKESFTVDGGVSSEHLRSIELYRTTFENDEIETGTDIGLKIRQAQQIHLHECWFEDVSKMVDIDGGNVSRPAALITFTGCHFGRKNVHASSATPVFLFNGSSDTDGRGSFLQSCWFKEGELQFNQKNRVKLEDCFFESGATCTGPSWFRTQATATDSLTYDALPTQDPWQITSINKVVQNPNYTSHRVDLVSLTHTMGSQTTTLMSYDFGQTALTAMVSAHVVAKNVLNTTQAAYVVTALFKNAHNGSTWEATRLGIQKSLEMEGDGLWDLDLVQSGTAVLVQGKGASTGGVRWVVSLSVLRLDGA